MANKRNQNKVSKRKMADRLKNTARMIREAKAKARELAARREAAEQNGEGLEGTSEAPPVEKPKVYKKAEPKPVEIVGSLDSRALRARPENLSYSLKRPPQTKYPKKRRKISEGSELNCSESNASPSIDGASIASLPTDGAELQGERTEHSEPPHLVKEEVTHTRIRKKHAKPGPKKKLREKEEQPKRRKYEGRLYEEDEQPKRHKYEKNLDCRAIIAKVYHFLEKEYEYMKEINDSNCDLTPLSNIEQRTASATGVSVKTVKNILLEEKRRHALVETLVVAYRKRKELQPDETDEHPVNEDFEGDQEPDPDPEPQEPVPQGVTENQETINIVKVEFVDEETEMNNAVASITEGDSGYHRVTDLEPLENSVTKGYEGYHKVTQLEPTGNSVTEGYQDTAILVKGVTESVTEGDQGYPTVTPGSVLFLQVGPIASGMPTIISTAGAISSNVETESTNEVPETKPDVNNMTTALHSTQDIDPLAAPEVSLEAVKTEPPDDTDITIESGPTEIPPDVPVAVKEIGSTLFVTYTE